MTTQGSIQIKLLQRHSHTDWGRGRPGSTQSSLIYREITGEKTERSPRLRVIKLDWKWHHWGPKLFEEWKMSRSSWNTKLNIQTSRSLLHTHGDQLNRQLRRYWLQPEPCHATTLSMIHINWLREICHIKVYNNLNKSSVIGVIH